MSLRPRVAVPTQYVICYVSQEAVSLTSHDLASHCFIIAIILEGSFPWPSPA